MSSPSDSGDSDDRFIVDTTKLEDEFASAAVEAQHYKEFHLRDLYLKREVILLRKPGFWSDIFTKKLGKFKHFFTSSDLLLLAHLTNFTIDRHEMVSDMDGEARSLRFTFEFEPNEYFEDFLVVKDFDFQMSYSSAGFVSSPVRLNWKGEEEDLTVGLLDAASELYGTEEMIRLNRGDDVFDNIERQNLREYEKLKEKLTELREAHDACSFFCWFGYRGELLHTALPLVETGEKYEVEADDKEEGNGLLDVEIFPKGKELVRALVDEVWPNAIDLYFNKIQLKSLDIGKIGREDQKKEKDEPPDLTSAEEDRSAKRSRTS